MPPPPSSLSIAAKAAVILGMVILIAHVLARNAVRGRGRAPKGAGAGLRLSPAPEPFEAAGAAAAAPAPAAEGAGGGDERSMLLDYVFGPEGTAATIEQAGGAEAPASAAPSAAARAVTSPDDPAQAGTSQHVYAAYNDESFMNGGALFGDAGLHGFDSAAHTFGAPLAAHG